ncbi:pyridoxamine 5'-phosphate oxidase-domain-containing protein [Podospora appendiculata]|uniref:Pyridoxamine 5'-phosphate oxidase-domain-containing protein n=1 Tax=Podospora appendiculata TaxID=314037 RepID=A0AAE0XIY7_9PEZI|nr:pyridoxamine 5'-phosphate oxidase-domain-containing protein [Podospora appendiculata]
MKPTAISLLLASCCSAAVAPPPPPPPYPDTPSTPFLFTNPAPSAGFRIPTSRESAILGRRILALTPLGTIATVFPADTAPSTLENRPAGLGGMPHGLMEYIADCETSADVGNPTLLAITIETSFKNIAAGSNVSLAVSWTPPHPPTKRIQSLPSRILSFLGLSSSPKHHHEHEHDRVPYSAANLPRFSILGHVEPIPDGDNLDKGEAGAKLASCFVDAHPDARYWLPGSRVHESHFVRLVVEHVYWVGGFGDRAYIGWIPVEEWKNVTRAEWEAVRLPGEKKGWKEWTVGAVSDL